MVNGGAWLSELAASQWTTSGSNIYYNTGNVGINDATPSYKLDVGGAICSVVGSDAVGINIDYAGEIGIMDVNEDILIAGRVGTYYHYGGNPNLTNSGLFINSGKVGVKTSTPSYDLDVVGLIGGSNIETNTTSKSTRLGYQALDSENETAARYNVAIGYDAGTALTTGARNTILGYNAGLSATLLTDNIFIGASAGYSTTESADNIFIGSASGYSGTVSSSNIFIGSASGYYNTTGGSNVLIGHQSGYRLTTGNYNTFTGTNSGNENTSGSSNTAYGFQSNYTNQTGSNNITIGYKSGYYNILSNRLYINNQNRTNLAGDTTKSIIYGYMDADPTLQRLTFNAKTYVNNSFNFGVDTLASDTYVAAITGITAYQTGLIIYFKANTANTGACTININSLGAKSLKAFNDQDPPDNYIEAGSIVHAIYDGTNFQMLQPDANP